MPSVYTSAIALSIKNAEADRLARDLAATTGETLTNAVVVALRERLEREQARGRVGSVDRLRRLAAGVAETPALDPQPADALVGYDEHGLPR